MLWRSVLAFLALPGIVAFAVPLALVAERLPSFSPRPLVMLVLLAGVCILVWCTVVFYVSGRGAVVAAAFWSMVLLAYAATVLAAFHIRIIAAEEPWLKRTFGVDWESYRTRVPRWLFRWA